MKFNSIYNNFSAGELSRNLIGRTDLDEYFKGAAEITNFIPTKQGGLSFRPGTSCVESNLTSKASRAFEFAPRDDEKYLVRLEPGNNIDVINLSGGIPVIIQPSHPWNTRVNFADATAAYSPIADDEAHKEIVDYLQVACSGDLMIVVDGRGILAPILIIRTALNMFYVDSIICPQTARALVAPYLYPPLLSLRVPYRDPNLNTNIRLVPSATTGSITISAQNASAAPLSFFTGDVVGMMVKITHAGVTGVAQITAKASDSSVTALVHVAFGAATAQTDFETSAWNPVDGYPKTVCFHEGRLIFGGNIKFQDMLWFSHTGNIYHFMQRRLAQDSTANTSGLNYFGAVNTTDPFNFIPSSVGANNIQWINTTDSLLVGTTGNEFSITGGQESFISVSSIFVKAISSHGSAKVQAVKIGSSVVFVSLDGKRILEIPKRLVEYTSATDWTGLAAGIVEKSIESIITDAWTKQNTIPIHSKITQISWDESNGILWCICKNKQGNAHTALISLTVDKTSKVIAWAKHNFSGEPYISSIVSVSDIQTFGSTKVFLTMQRLSSFNYSLETFTYKTMHDSYLPGGNVLGPQTVYLDGAMYTQTVYTPSPTTLPITLTQAAVFPPGTTFGVIAFGDNSEGIYVGSFEEVGGLLTVPNLDPDKMYLVGALYEGEIKTMPSEAGAQFGVAQGSPRRVHEISVFVDRSLGGVYKASKSSNEFPIVGSKGSPDALYTGEVKLSLNASPDDHQVILKQTVPYPLTILWLLTKGYTYDA